MRRTIVPLLGCLLFASSCGRHGENTVAHRQMSTVNRMVLVFEGQHLGEQVFPKAIYLEDMGKVKTVFTPDDAVSIEQSAFCFLPVWSPSEDWLLLPDGRFDGFAVFKAHDLPVGLTDRSKMLRIGVADPSGIRWWHEFTRWKSRIVFEFRAGLSDQLVSFECNLASAIVSRIDKLAVPFRQLPK